MDQESRFCPSSASLEGGEEVYRFPGHFLGAVQNVYPSIAAYIRTFLSEVR